MPPDGTVTIAQSPEDLRASVKAQIVEGKPTFFKLEAQLPKQGRTDTPLAASDKMWVVLKTYAADGENGLHAHPKPAKPEPNRLKYTQETRGAGGEVEAAADGALPRAPRRGALLL